MTERPTVFIIHTDAPLLNEVRRIATSVGADFHHCSTVADFLSAGADRHGCLICAHHIQDGNAIELLEKTRAGGNFLPVIVVTRDAETRTIAKSMQRGAFTVLDDSVGKDELWDAIRKAIALDREYRRSVAECTEIDRRLASLSTKERDVLELMTAGHPNKVIASRLGVSVRTVESRRHTIFKNTQTKSLAELLAMVYRHELWRRVLLGQSGPQQHALLTLSSFQASTETVAHAPTGIGVLPISHEAATAVAHERCP